MALSFPFNHRPASSFIQTIPYVVPAGFYARITPLGVDFEFQANQFGFREENHDTVIGPSAPPIDILLTTNNSPYNLYVESGMLPGSLSFISGYFGTYVQALNNPGVILKDYSIDADGLGDHSYQVTASTPSPKSSHIFRLPPGHDLRLEFQDPSAAHTTFTRVWSEGKIGGEYWANPGDSIDGDIYFVEQYKIPD